MQKIASYNHQTNTNFNCSVHGLVWVDFPNQLQKKICSKVFHALKFVFLEMHFLFIPNAVFNAVFNSNFFFSLVC